MSARAFRIPVATALAIVARSVGVPVALLSTMSLLEFAQVIEQARAARRS